MRVAYADPPYIGQAQRHYRELETDHVALIERLVEEYPEGWALSLSSPTLKQVLNMIPDGYDYRVMAWVKPFAVFKPNVNPAYAWEPVVVHGGRSQGRDVPTVRDWVAESITLQRGLVGVKPDGFSYWLFSVLGLYPDDVFHDLYPGTGAVTEAWESWRKWERGEQVALVGLEVT
jgi:hypothetical protein